MSEAHLFPTQIYSEDAEDAGIVYYATYFRFLERGCSDLEREAGIDQGALLDSEHLMFSIRRCEIDYLQSARPDNQIEARNQIQKTGGTSMDIGLDIHRGHEHIVRTKVRLTRVGRSGWPQHLPTHSRAAPNEIAFPS